MRNLLKNTAARTANAVRGYVERSKAVVNYAIDSAGSMAGYLAGSLALTSGPIHVGEAHEMIERTIYPNGDVRERTVYK